MPKVIGNVELRMAPEEQVRAGDLKKTVVDFINGARKKLYVAEQEPNSEDITNHLVTVGDRKSANTYGREFAEIQEGQFSTLTRGLGELPRDPSVSECGGARAGQGTLVAGWLPAEARSTALRIIVL